MQVLTGSHTGKTAHGGKQGKMLVSLFWARLRLGSSRYAAAQGYGSCYNLSGNRTGMLKHSSHPSS